MQSQFDQIELKLLNNPDNRYFQLAYSILMSECESPIAQSKWQANGRSLTSLGFSTNPSRLSNLNAFEITLPEGTLSFLNQSKPKSSVFGGVDISVNLIYNNQYSLAMSVSRQEYAMVAEQESYFIGIDSVINKVDLAGLSVSKQTLFGIEQNTLKLFYKKTLSKKISFGVVLAENSYRNATIFNDNQLNIEVSAFLDNTLKVQAAAISSFPQQIRAGGRYDALEFNLIKGRSVSEGVNAFLGVGLRFQKDSQAYSPLIKNNAVRELVVLKGMALLEKSFKTKFLGDFKSYARVSYLEQKSSLAMFEWHTLDFELGLLKSW
ncbi:hypothetical protein [Thiosulfativibrio zosterae]|uniref:hypothetical protein n=1 Tax=Thiosulfativibrio zosterae TaxID=2675053 RepID=UPI0015657153|nr:hypothetical protein [Thiosulfativibrio zosterae]